MNFLGVASRAAWFTAISLVLVLVSAVAASRPASANLAHAGVIDGFTYDAPVDAAISQGFEAVASMVPAVDSQWSARMAIGVIGHVYDLSPNRVAPNSLFRGLTHADEGIKPYSVQRTVTAGHGGEIQAHHLIERRFADVVGGNTDEWASIVVTRSEHTALTTAWRQQIPYGAGTRNATRAQVEAGGA